jgi:hypothetical protein
MDDGIGSPMRPKEHSLLDPLLPAIFQPIGACGGVKIHLQTVGVDCHFSVKDTPTYRCISHQNVGVIVTSIVGAFYTEIYP